MASVKIVKDGCRPMKVPAKSIPKYEACGWKVSGKKNKPVVEEEVESEDVEEEDEETESHKSVDDMTMEELYLNLPNYLYGLEVTLFVALRRM